MTWRERRVEKGIFWALLVLLVWAPVPLGSNRPWAWALLAMGSFALAGLWTVLWMLGRVRIPESLLRAWPAFAALALWILYTAVSILPLPRDWVAILSPASAGLHALSDLAGVPRESFTLSIDAHASEMALLKSLVYAAVFFLFLAVVNNRRRFLIAANVLVYAATLHALYALAMHLSRVTESYLGATIVHGAAATGFFPNQNHFAGMLEMSAAIGIGLLAGGRPGRGDETWKQMLKSLAGQVFTNRMLLRVALCVLVVALAATHSRMGNTAFVASLAIAAALSMALARRLRPGLLVLLASIVIIDLVAVGSWFGTEKLAERLESTTFQDVEDRSAVARLSLGIIRDYPLFGSGAGTFYTAFPRYRTDEIRNFFDHAHNDYVQVTAESGALGAAFLAFVVAASLACAVAGERVRSDPAMKAASFASIMGVSAILIHSWADFNLQIPANAMLFMVLLAFGWISRFLNASAPAAPPPGAPDVA